MESIRRRVGTRIREVLSKLRADIRVGGEAIDLNSGVVSQCLSFILHRQCVILTQTRRHILSKNTAFMIWPIFNILFRTNYIYIFIYIYISDINIFKYCNHCEHIRVL